MAIWVEGCKRERERERELGDKCAVIILLTNSESMYDIGYINYNYIFYGPFINAVPSNQATSTVQIYTNTPKKIAVQHIKYI